ncbi:MAG: type II toxin-antitoxin system VapC family toxin [Myxococcota bacterium]
MRALLDTHTFLWWLDGDERLPEAARDLIADDRNVIYVSAASAWEISTKVRTGKLPGAVEVAASMPECITTQGFETLVITVPHVQRAGALPGPHRDPFDRMLVAQSQAENLPLVSNDAALDAYGVVRLWSTVAGAG